MLNLSTTKSKNDTLISNNAKDIQKHLKESTSFGGKLGYAVNGNEIIEIIYARQPKLKTINTLVEMGFTTFVKTFAFMPFQKSQITKKLDLMSNTDVLKAFAYMEQF